MSDSSRVTFSTDPEDFDIPLIHAFLTESYWANGRSLEHVRASIENSLSFGIFLGRKQIGFARVVTDRVVFAYLMDVFVVPEHRGQRYAQKLLEYIFLHPELLGVETWFLKTKDAHGLYRKLGFQTIDEPECFMVRARRANDRISP